MTAPNEVGKPAVYAMHMTTEELNTQLYEKMFADQEKYRQWLLTQPPDEILNHAYEYTIRNDILLSLEYNNLNGKQAQALLKSPCPLGDVFKARTVGRWSVAI